ncbi:aminotransferase class V-fold PLP-dependent enzyme [Lewinella cohaerens]|uniref:aminotransferase class V-fold PLP-dependent enzyme n=1 Tax=Lewinella cohaerens TaxID=70995 RepID=UPI00037DB025|nr:aminotransferase class V-fold PLP-dependent enzyme [Lewinella cohaerens]
MNALREQYPALENFTYLNSCSSGLMSKELLAFRRNLDEDYQLQGSNFRAGVYDKIRAIKAVIANTFGGNTERTALIPSCSHGINMVLDALANGQKVLHLPGDYPSIVWPFTSRNFVCTTLVVEGPDTYSLETLSEAIESQHIEILAVSAVQYSNGEIIPPATFRALKDRFPDLLIIVDATQFLGIAPFHFHESGIDLLVASAFKWLCAGYGNGVLFISEALEKLLNSKLRGYNTYKNPRKEGEPTTGEYFEPGHQDLLAFQSLRFQVEQHQAIGYDQIQAQIQKVKNYARRKIVAETPYTIITSEDPGMASGILSVEAPPKLVKHLNEQQIVCSYNRGLRLGIHFYNNEEDIDQLVRAMKD